MTKEIDEEANAGLAISANKCNNEASEFERAGDLVNAARARIAELRFKISRPDLDDLDLAKVSTKNKKIFGLIELTRDLPDEKPSRGDMLKMHRLEDAKRWLGEASALRSGEFISLPKHVGNLRLTSNQKEESILTQFVLGTILVLGEMWEMKGDFAKARDARRMG